MNHKTVIIVSWFSQRAKERDPKHKYRLEIKRIESSPEEREFENLEDLVKEKVNIDSNVHLLPRKTNIYWAAS